ncbi:unnamed protein product [Closterium sp. NIES-65]|nr:unnamed protein product [Closterium sp. NIES-65]
MTISAFPLPISPLPSPPPTCPLSLEALCNHLASTKHLLWCDETAPAAKGVEGAAGSSSRELDAGGPGDGLPRPSAEALTATWQMLQVSRRLSESDPCTSTIRACLGRLLAALGIWDASAVSFKPPATATSTAAPTAVSAPTGGVTVVNADPAGEGVHEGVIVSVLKLLATLLVDPDVHAIQLAAQTIEVRPVLALLLPSSCLLKLLSQDPSLFPVASALRLHRVTAILMTERGHRVFTATGFEEKQYLEAHIKTVNTAHAQQIIQRLRADAGASMPPLDDPAVWQAVGASHEAWVCRVVHLLILHAPDDILTLCAPLCRVNASLAALLLPHTLATLAASHAPTSLLCRTISTQLTTHVLQPAHAVSPRTLQLLLDALTALRACHTRARIAPPPTAAAAARAAASAMGARKSAAKATSAAAPSTTTEASTRTAAGVAGSSSKGKRGGRRGTKKSAAESAAGGQEGPAVGAEAEEAGAAQLRAEEKGAEVDEDEPEAPQHWQSPVWLQLDLLTLAQAAQHCGATLTAILYAELWCEAHFGRPTLGEPSFDEDSDAFQSCLDTCCVVLFPPPFPPLTLNAHFLPMAILSSPTSPSKILPLLLCWQVEPHEALLMGCYSAVNEPDAIYAVARTNKLPSRLAIDRHEGRWEKVLETLDHAMSHRPAPAGAALSSGATPAVPSLHTKLPGRWASGTCQQLSSRTRPTRHPTRPPPCSYSQPHLAAAAPLRPPCLVLLLASTPLSTGVLQPPLESGAPFVTLTAPPGSSSTTTSAMAMPGGAAAGFHAALYRCAAAVNIPSPSLPIVSSSMLPPAPLSPRPPIHRPLPTTIVCQLASMSAESALHINSRLILLQALENVREAAAPTLARGGGPPIHAGQARHTEVGKAGMDGECRTAHVAAPAGSVWEQLRVTGAAAELSGGVSAWVDCRAADCRAADCRAADCHAADCRAADCRAADCRAADCRAADCPAADCPAADCPAADCPAADCRAADCPAADCPAADCPAADCPAADCRAPDSTCARLLSQAAVQVQHLKDACRTLTARSHTPTTVPHLPPTSSAATASAEEGTWGVEGVAFCGRVEEAKLLALEGQQDMAVRLLQHLLRPDLPPHASQGSASPSAASAAVTTAAVTTAAVTTVAAACVPVSDRVYTLGLAAKWLGETRSISSRVVLNDYLWRAVDLTTHPPTASHSASPSAAAAAATAPPSYASLPFANNWHQQKQERQWKQQQQQQGGYGGQQGGEREQGGQGGEQGQWQQRRQWGEVHFQMARYVDGLFVVLHTRLHSQQWRAAQDLTNHKEDERRVYGMKMMELQKQLSMDDQEANDLQVQPPHLAIPPPCHPSCLPSVQGEHDMYLRAALENYRNCLLAADTFNIKGVTVEVVFRLTALWFTLLKNTNADTVFRLTALWFTLLNDATADAVNAEMLTTIQTVPSYKFLPLVYQMASRMSERDPHGSPPLHPETPDFQSVLTTLVKRMADDHPLHTVPVLMALANGNRVRSSQRGRNLFVVDEDKIRAAKAVLGGMAERHKPMLDELLVKRRAKPTIPLSSCFPPILALPACLPAKPPLLSSPRIHQLMDMWIWNAALIRPVVCPTSPQCAIFTQPACLPTKPPLPLYVPTDAAADGSVHPPSGAGVQQGGSHAFKAATEKLPQRQGPLAGAGAHSLGACGVLRLLKNHLLLSSPHAREAPSPPAACPQVPVLTASVPVDQTCCYAPGSFPAFCGLKDSMR